MKNGRKRSLLEGVMCVEWAYQHFPPFFLFFLRLNSSQTNRTIELSTTSTWRASTSACILPSSKYPTTKTNEWFRISLFNRHQDVILRKKDKSWKPWWWDCSWNRKDVRNGLLSAGCKMAWHTHWCNGEEVLYTFVYIISSLVVSIRQFWLTDERCK